MSDETLRPSAYRRVRVYAGGSTRSGLPLDVECPRAWVRRFCDTLSALSEGGGCTVYDRGVTGCWAGYTEPVAVVETIAPDEVWRTHRANIDAVAQRFLAATQQDAVLITAEWLGRDEVHFIAAHDGEGVVSS